MRKKNYFKKIYNFDTTSNSYCIDVSLENYKDVYNDWDPSPFKKRDLEEGFDDFIVNASEDIPLKYKITIVLHLPEAIRDANKENTIRSAYQNHYNHVLQRLDKSLSDLFRKGSISFVLSLVFLTVGSIFFKDEKSIFFRVLNEGIFIGGWVFLWEFFTDISIKRMKIVDELKLYKRLQNAEVRFIY
jgi:hypothetical protein